MMEKKDIPVGVDVGPGGGPRVGGGGAGRGGRLDDPTRGVRGGVGGLWSLDRAVIVLMRCVGDGGEHLPTREKGICS